MPSAHTRRRDARSRPMRDRAGHDQDRVDVEDQRDQRGVDPGQRGEVEAGLRGVAEHAHAQPNQHGAAGEFAQGAPRARRWRSASTGQPEADQQQRVHRHACVVGELAEHGHRPEAGGGKQAEEASHETDGPGWQPFRSIACSCIAMCSYAERMLDLHRLRLLREVHGRGTVHGAARALGYTPSAISQQLAVLEREAGTPLLERVGRNVRLTAAGSDPGAARRPRCWKGSRRPRPSWPGRGRAGWPGVVRVAAFQSAFLRIVAPAVRALAVSHPDVRVEAAEVEVEQAAPALRLHQLDVVVGDEYDGQPRAVHADLERERLLRERIRVVLPADHPEAGVDRVSIGRLADARGPLASPAPGTARCSTGVPGARRVRARSPLQLRRLPDPAGVGAHDRGGCAAAGPGARRTALPGSRSACRPRAPSGGRSSSSPGEAELPQWPR